jgi:enhancing lycopene biosynthesis protein 2
VEEETMTNVAVILSGCGFMDGAEIRESVITLLELSRAGVTTRIFAPDMDQHHTINHLTGDATKETRNVLVESARIARGEIEELGKLKASDFDALIIPGGFGVAKNLSDLAFQGPNATVLPEFRSIILDFLKQGKPIAAICISPAVLVAATKGHYAPKVTIGEDQDTANAIEAMGGSHEECPSERCIWDAKHQIASCSAYMRGDDNLAAIADGISACVERTLQAARDKAKAA